METLPHRELVNLLERLPIRTSEQGVTGRPFLPISLDQYEQVISVEAEIVPLKVRLLDAAADVRELVQVVVVLVEGGHLHPLTLDGYGLTRSAAVTNQEVDVAGLPLRVFDDRPHHVMSDKGVSADFQLGEEQVPERGSHEPLEDVRLTLGGHVVFVETFVIAVQRAALASAERFAFAEGERIHGGNLELQILDRKSVV